MTWLIKCSIYLQVICFINYLSKLMKTFLKPVLIALAVSTFGCRQSNSEGAVSNTDTVEAEAVGQSGVVDETSSPNIVQTAASSKDHTTLVAAVKAADLVDALSNAGPFTVFAPTNAAFERLPAGTVEELLKPEKKAELQNILEYHTYVGVLKAEYMQDGQEFEMVAPAKVKITKQGEKTFVNGSEIIGTIETSNGIIHVISDVLLPK
jgi:uncharacterized surface protein with fasciclin (FAS1) repeats